jgi:hypothetical protein
VDGGGGWVLMFGCFWRWERYVSPVCIYVVAVG